MGLSFLTPAFLLGLAVLSIPILIHLTHREKREIVEFPSLMFLRKIPYRSVRRQRIRQWLLFLMRTLALLMIVAAFTRPFWEQAGSAATSIMGARELVVLLDRSYSMGYADRWNRGREAALAAIDTLQVDDRATLILFSERAEAVNQPSSDRAALANVVNDARLGSGKTRYGPALKLAKKTLEESELPRREAILITDFQRVGWEGHEDVQFLDGTALSWVDLSNPETTNLSIASVVLEREYQSGRERVVTSARLTNKGGRAFEQVRVELELGGRQIQEKRVSLEPNSSKMVMFDPFTLPEGISRGVVRIEEDALPQDNVFYFVVWPGQSISVTVVDGGRQGRQSLYLRRALAIGDRPSFDVEVKSLSTLEDRDLSRSSVVFLNDISPPSERTGQRLRGFVERGGGLVVVLGEGSGRTGWSDAAEGLLPGTWSGARTIDRSPDWGGTLSFVDYSHELFELFKAPHSGDFSTAKFFRYRPIEVKSGARVLARFDDANVSLAESRVGNGKVLLWSSTLDTFWNDLALQPVFLPFVHQVTKYASGYAEAEHWRTVGDVLDVSRFLGVVETSLSLPLGGDGATDGPELVATTPTGNRIALSQEEQEQYLMRLEEQGFYDVKIPDTEPSEAVSWAVNLDVTESDLSVLDPEELEAAVRYRGGSTSVAAASEWTPVDQERTQNFWWFLLSVAFLLLVVETMWSNRLSRLAR